MNLWFHKGAWASKRARKIVAQLDTSQITKIAVIRHAALGDMVLTRPFLLELRRFFPNAGITLSVVSNYTVGVPGDLVDRVHVLYGTDRRDVAKREQIKRARELGEQDLIFDLAATPRSLRLCRLTVARLKIGFPYKAVVRRLVYDMAVWRSDLRCETDNMLDMLNMIGCKTNYPPEFNLPGIPLKREKPYVVYFTTASIRYKCWPKDRFADFIALMVDDYPDYDHIVLQGMADWESVESIMRQFTDNSNVLDMKLENLDDVISLLKGAALLVSNDTGIRNLGVSCEIPTLGIFFITTSFRATPFRYWPRYGVHDVVFNADGSMPDVSAVYQAARAILDNSSQSRLVEVAE